MSLKMNWKIIIFIPVTLLTGWIALDFSFVKRYATFVISGADPHVIGLDWYQPKYVIRENKPSEAAVLETETGLAPVTPEEAELYQKAADYAFGQGGQALLISRRGIIVYERYKNATTRETLFNPQSMSKSLLALAVGHALTEGAITSLDSPIENHLPALKNDPRGAITIRNLLQMSGGLEQISKDYSPYPWSRGVRQHFGADFDHWVMQLRLADPPGTKFDYNNNESNLLGMVLEQAVGKPYQQYLSENIWPAFGLGGAQAYLDRKDGSVMKSCCIFSRPVDWLALGQIVLDKGALNGRQVIDPGYMEEMTTPSSNYDGYGYHLWLKPLELRGGHTGTPKPENPTQWWAAEPYLDTVYSFSGFGFHKTWIIPSLDMVVVRVNGRQWPDEAFDQSKIPNMLLRALSPEAD